MPLRNNIARSSKKLIRKVVPLVVRKSLAKFISRQSWLSGDHRAGWSMELVRDMADKDANEYHKFLWSNHIGYADTYEISQRFGEENINESRKLLFSDMTTALTELKINYKNEIKSVLDVGSSLGYLLKHLEDNVFVCAKKLDGIDIDAQAIEKGASYLQANGSKIQLTCLDMENLTNFLSDKMYDIILCAGTVIYLEEEKAEELVKNLLQHTATMLVITGIASPENDNSELDQSKVRARDGSYIHNLDRMVNQLGGNIVFRRWQGKEMIGGNTLYFVFATPPH